MNTRIKTDTTLEVLQPTEVMQFIKFEDTTEGDEVGLIVNLIKGVRSHFEKRTGLSFLEKTYETFFRHSESPYILPVSPVISVDTVETVDHEGTKTELTLNSDYHKKGLYEIEIFPYSLSTIANPWHSFEGTYDLLVTYKAGYGHTDTETIPEDLKQAMLKQIIRWYDNRDDFLEGTLLPEVNRILNLYKKLII
jgi:uncharacterized phiE125 gp8 family phage protein